ncbi:MAG: hypothetical protein V1747_04730 [Candidatus Omnitrophota bacterium]
MIMLSPRNNFKQIFDNSPQSMLRTDPGLKLVYAANSQDKLE